MVLAVAVAAMALVGARPFRIREWVWALAGACAIIFMGAEPFAAAARAIGEQWNVLLFILGLMELSTAAEFAGVFEWLAEDLQVRAGGSRRRLFVMLFLAGAVVTVLLSNDATAIVFTPVVYRSVVKRGGDALPYLYACAFVANAASFGLPFSNPANVLVLPHPHLFDYVRHLGVPMLAAVAINLGLFLWIFRKELDGTYPYRPASSPDGRVHRMLTVLACVVVAYVAAILAHWELGPVALAGGLAALVAARMPAREATRRIGWSSFALLAGLFVLLDAVARAGLVTWALQTLDALSRHGAWAVIAAGVGGAALVSNALNNLPVAIASAHIVHQAALPRVAYPLIVGIDLGPNLTIGGSLATLLWLGALRERGYRVSFRQYLRLGIVVVPPTLAAGALWLWLVR